jgi:hypothetical protein
MWNIFRFLVLFSFVTSAFSDEIRPGYLEITETSTGVFAVLWKVPIMGDVESRLMPVFPEHCREVTPVAMYPTSASLLRRWTIECADGLHEQTIPITGLRETVTDVLAQFQWLDGSSQVARAGPGDPTLHIGAAATTSAIIYTYTVLGIEHILEGIDHLLFVFALLVIVGGFRRLIATITAFTIAHSITLAAATLGYVNVPGKPVEAVIALSILFLAVEIVHGCRGRVGAAERFPWLVAFTFGLLHGFGFAGALAEIGLPQHEIPLALVFFNVGVELGQLIFVLFFIGVTWLARRAFSFNGTWVRILPAYAIGSVASWWTIERVLSFWTL